MNLIILINFAQVPRDFAALYPPLPSQTSPVSSSPPAEKSHPVEKLVEWFLEHKEVPRNNNPSGMVSAYEVELGTLWQNCTRNPNGTRKRTYVAAFNNALERSTAMRAAYEKKEAKRRARK